jgi:hypothetical protein
MIDILRRQEPRYVVNMAHCVVFYGLPQLRASEAAKVDRADPMISGFAMAHPSLRYKLVSCDQ